MKNTLLISLALTASAFGQGAGPLVPPSAPADGTYRTLGELWDKLNTIEAQTAALEVRRDLATVAGDANSNHRISAPGSYYLSGNLNVNMPNGITIAASGVTLDLNGFELFRNTSVGASFTAITIGASLRNIQIHNGHITGAVEYLGGIAFGGNGFEHGIDIPTDDTVNVRVRDVKVTGCSGDGIDLNQRPENTVERCSVRAVGGKGIRGGDIHHCTAITCGGTAIDSFGSVSHSHGVTVSEQSGATGIYSSGTVSDSIGEALGASAREGISALGNVADCTGSTEGTGNGVDGIVGDNVSNSVGTTRGAAGISASGNVANSTGSSSGNHSSSKGIDASGTVSNSNGTASNASGADGIDAAIVNYSRGSTSGTGVGIRATTAVGSIAIGGEAITNKYLMP